MPSSSERKPDQNGKSISLSQGPEVDQSWLVDFGSTFSSKSQPLGGKRPTDRAATFDVLLRNGNSWRKVERAVDYVWSLSSSDLLIALIHDLSKQRTRSKLM